MSRKSSLWLLLVCLAVAGNPSSAADNVIQIGHIINITVLEHAELSQAVIVYEDGTTDYPLLANIPIDGMSVSELSTFLAPILTRYVERPLFFINISEYRMLNVRVLGQVMKPGPHQVRGPIGIQGILAEAGGGLKEADLRNVTIVRYDGDKVQEINVDMYDFFRKHTDIELPLIRNGDLIIVPMLTNQSYVRVIGNVRSPGKYVPSSDENIADMIYLAGGMDDKGNLNDVKYISFTDGKYVMREFKINSLIQKGMSEEIPIVSPGDIIVVGAFPFWRDMNFVSQFIRDIALIISSYVLIQRL